MKKCIVVSDSFKGTLSSLDICQIARETFAQVAPECELVTIPVADGGEGTVDCFVQAMNAIPVTVTVQGPFGDPVEAVYARMGDAAVIEMAAAAGLNLAGERKDPSKASTYGVGELMRHAVEHGCQEIFLGIGGSATNDGGCGCAAALGVRFSDETGAAFLPTGGTLDRIRTVDTASARLLLKDIPLRVMCDVTNPLYGPNGAAYVFGPQKGADPAMVERLDGQLKAFAGTLQRGLGADVSALPGAGAAGGMGAGCVALLGGKLSSGIDAVLSAVGFEEQLKDADMVISGEGRLDSQSFQGKVISGIARRTGEAGVPLVILAGSIDDSARAAAKHGVTAVFNTNRAARPMSEVPAHCREDYCAALTDLLCTIRMAEDFKR